MKKFITLLSAALISVASLATVASAAPIADDVFKPTIAADITKVTSKGNATITFTANLESDLDLVYDEDEEIWTGFGIRGSGIKMTVNTDMFEVAEVALGEAYNKLEDVVASEDKVAVLGTVKAQLKAAYIGKSVDELNALNFGDVYFAELIISSWEEADDFKQELTQTKYRDDGQGNFAIDLSKTRIGTYVDEPVTPPTPPAPTASVAISAAKKTTDANWIAENGNTMFWGVDFANGGFNGTAVAKIFSDAKERELTIATPAETAINGEASFGVFVIVGDSTDAIGLTVTSGDVTATVAPVAYADAE